MIKRFTLFVLFTGLALALRPQSSQDATVALRTEVDTATLSIALDWPNPAASTILLKRRKKGQAGNQWTTLLNLSNSTVSTYTDTSLEKGSTYEYSLRRFTTYNSYGFAHVAMLAPVVDYRGKILIFIDSTTADATGVELKKFKDGIRGDGWQTIPIKTGPSSTVQSIKNRIVSEYNADPENLKAVLLIGEIPVPYSGNSAWDGHPDHTGAWPCDNYYADVDGPWTDASVNTTSPGRDANDNVPGDGKFDQNIMPSAAELMVGRIDFHRLDSATFGASHEELINRYFIKNRKWRNKQYTVDYKALVDDNFGYFGGEAFAANGYRNAYPLVGADSIVTADFLNDTKFSSFLLGYACGGGSYTSAAGVGNSTEVAADSINVVFSNIFGSYHGDWDYESNPLMPSVLASKGGILTCSWAGRPHWFMQGLASGETIGFCTQETLNAQFNTEYTLSGFGRSGAHVALLGDPTVRAHIIAPVPELSAESTCTSVGLKWSASPDTGILGYLVYRSLSLDGPYIRLTDNLVDGLSWSDAEPVSDTVFYQVRPVRIDHAPGGGYFYNAGTGIILEHIHSGAPSVTLSASYPVIDCYSPCVQLLVGVEGPGQSFDIQIVGPGPVDTSWIVCQPGTYTLVVENLINGCTATATQVVFADFTPPEILAETITNASAAGASDGAIHLEIPFGAMYNIIWGDGSIGQTITGLLPGTYSVVVSNALTGCSLVREYQIGITTKNGEVPSDLNWTLTPVPAVGQITLNVPANMAANFGELVLFDLQGKMLLRQTVSASATPIDISGLGAGIYRACRFENGRMKQGRSFIKI